MQLVEQLKQKFNSLEPRQKVLVPLVGVVALFLVYELYETFFGGDDYTVPAAPARVEQPHPAIPQQANAVRSPNQQAMHTGPRLPLTLPQRQEPRKVAVAQPNDAQKALLSVSQQNQSAYVQMLSEYQLLQMREMLAQANASIAASHVKQAEANAAIKKLEGESGVPTTRHSSAPVPATTLPTGPSAQQATNFTVTYLGQQRGNWSAILSQDSNLYEVRPGSRLPNDVKVIGINGKGVLVEHDDFKRFIPIPPSLAN